MAYLDQLTEFLKENKIPFKQLDRYCQAFTHSSYVNEHRHLKIEDNERLEYLGDAVLELTVSNYLFNLKPALSEGEMTKIRAQLVCEPSLESYARNLNLGKLMLLGRGEENSGGRERPTVLADAFEAFIGAMYLDLGMDTVYSFVHTIIHKAYQVKSHKSLIIKVPCKNLYRLTLKRQSNIVLSLKQVQPIIVHSRRSFY